MSERPRSSGLIHGTTANRLVGRTLTLKRGPVNPPLGPTLSPVVFNVLFCGDCGVAVMGRVLTSHKVNGLNEALLVNVLDEPGQGNACHEYQIRQRQYAHVAAINDWTTMVNHYKEWEVVSYEFIKDDMNYKVVVVKWSQYKQKGTTVEARTHTVRLPYKPNVGQIIQCPNLI